MVALVDRYTYSLIARAVLRGVPRDWMEDVYGMALVPDKIFYLDIDIEHLVSRVIDTTGLDYWESGQDFLGKPDLYDNYVEYQRALLNQYRTMADEFGFHVIDGKQPIGVVFAALKAGMEDVIAGMAPQPPESDQLDPTLTSEIS